MRQAEAAVKSPGQYTWPASLPLPTEAPGKPGALTCSSSSLKPVISCSVMFQHLTTFPSMHFKLGPQKDCPTNLDRTALGVPGRNLIHSAPVFLLVKHVS